MARIRTIKPGFWTDEKLSQLPPLVRMTFLGLISAMADDEGRCKGDVRLVKASIWPLDDDVTVKTIAAHLSQLCTAGRIVLYEVEGARYIQIVNWKKHQRIDKPRPSELPAPPASAGNVADDSTKTPRIVQEDSTLDRDKEVEGSRKGSGAEAEAAGIIPPSCAPPASLLSALGLPDSALALLGMFYEPALSEKQRDRYREVVQQLWETLDPRHPGPKIRGGTRVKARDKDHLDFVCRRVMADPPNDRDMAIVFVLKKLLDPPPGPTPAEKHKAQTDAAIAEEEAYRREARDAGLSWANDHPDEYAPILAAVDAEFKPASLNSFSKLAREAQLSQRCARAAGFPDFAAWQLKRRGSAA